MVEVSRERLADLLVDPQEDLEFEIKNWLNLADSNDDKAILAKSVIALANHGGGFVALGLTGTDQGYVESDNRPQTLDGYHQDLINGIVQNYCDPPFHCNVHLVRNPAGALFPIVVVPGGHRVPVRAKRGGPNGNTVTNNAIYIRKAGPRSEMPQSAQDWDELLARCLRNRRDEMFSQIRDLITGAVPQAASVATDELDQWITKSRERWTALTRHLGEDDGPRMRHGRFLVAYQITGDRKAISGAQLRHLLSSSVVRHTGWPPFWYPSRAEIAPYPYEGTVECWLGADTQTPDELRDPAYSDFWRIDPNGLAFLIRGYQEDGEDAQRPHRQAIAPGTVFDLVLPIWRIGEALLHAKRLSDNLFDGPTTVRFVAQFEGLAGRALSSIDGTRYLSENRVARQDSIRLETNIETSAIDATLPEVVHPLLTPLYGLFDFFELPMSLVAKELGRLRGSTG
ncbi:hypothetical protein HJB89_11125 [Rhizobium sp. NZLR8]|uniref:AlbA family DNA-binding domain-containing protein n=1 Tax=Rhizobium sp. NZLR8 TaxID=2731104 RepID=UPI001C838FAA|nr:ATP-binding protein [Rhizobium sp. NZLR8]MBX5157674.1 hypothetical protein [Rhizobium sp. NZLR8]